MFAVFIEADASDADMDAGMTHLKETVVPRVRDEGARAGYWINRAAGTQRVAMVLFDTEEAARAMAGRLKVGESPDGAPESLILRTVEVSEVMASL